MRNLVFILIIIVSLSSCRTEETNTNKINNSSIDSSESLEELSTLEGIWGMTSYFDSIVANKKIAEFRIQPPTWFAFLIEINPDSISNYGSINDGIVERLDTDTIARFESMGGKWNLIDHYPQLILINTSQEYGEVDSTIYVFRKRDDLEFLTENLSDKRLKLDSNITDYFNKELLSGQYLDGNVKVVLGTDGTVQGLKEYTNYKTRNYFGTLHPFNQMDVVYFSNEEVQDYWSWEFSDENLILTKLKADWEKTDKYWPTKEQIVLVKN